MKILIVYEEVPESTTFYSVDVDAETWAWMKWTHGNFINNEMSDAAEAACVRLTDWLDVNATPMTVDDGPILVRGEGFDYVLHTGFIL